jgi:hypothetical protein
MLWRRGKAYSQDLRERVLAATDDGVPVSRIAALLCAFRRKAAGHSD